MVDDTSRRFRLHKKFPTSPKRRSLIFVFSRQLKGVQPNSNPMTEHDDGVRKRKENISMFNATLLTK